MFAYRWAENDDDEIQEPTAVAWDEAACRDGSGSLTALFFSDEIPEIEMAKAVCSTCALAEPCLRGALARREPVGVWGGQLFADGVVIARKRKRGRPPKAAAGMPSDPTLTARDEVPGGHLLEYPTPQLKTA
jgi:WhiB family redox-sensing transcriptional regulator